MQMEPHEIKAAALAVDRVKSIDETIASLGRDLEVNAENCGGKVRDVLGRNLLHHLGTEHVGQIVICGVINALLRMRNDTAQEHSGVVLFPDQPCPDQFPQDTP